ncbi:MAG: ABC transporter permease [Dehalococcoidales bacterium]|nr:ABC transporter permease [Dehalococcoidales bacterium]
MNLRRIGILFKKELFQGPRGFMFVWAIVMPIIFSFVLAAIFGTLTSEKPRLGVLNLDEYNGDSSLTSMLEQYESIKYREYTDESAIRKAVEDGAVDMGIIVPVGLDESIKNREYVEIDAYIWGESQAKNRTILTITITNMIRELAGQESPVDINSISLGDKEVIPWSVRVLPLLMVFAVFLGGVFIPATSLIDEKIKRTMTALIVTPTSVIDVFIAKGFLGFLMSLSVGIIVLLVNKALGIHPFLLIMILALGGVMAVEIGLIFGALLKDISTLFAIWKTSAILLVGPGFIYMFPAIPQWIGRIFPTYYMLEPLMNITQKGAGWSQIAGNTLILLGIDVVIFIIFIFVLRRSSQFSV